MQRGSREAQGDQQISSFYVSSDINPQTTQLPAEHAFTFTPTHEILLVDLKWLQC